MQEINVTQLIKIKEVRELLKSFINTAYLKEFKFEINTPIPEHKEWMQVGTTVDYLVRKSLQINHGLEFEEELYCEKSLNLYLDHPEILFLNYEEMEWYYPPKIKFFKNHNTIDEELLKTTYEIATLDAIGRSGKFYGGHAPKAVVNDLKELSINIENFSEKLKFNEIKLNPTIGKMTESLLIKADADLIIDDCIIEIKTSKDPSIKLDYILQLLIYVMLYDGDIKRLGILNPRAKEVIYLDLKSLLTKDLSEAKNLLKF